MYHLELNLLEKQELETLLKTENNNKVYRRLQCIHFKTLGFKHKVIAGSIGVNIDTVTDWLKLYKHKGFKGLCSLHYDGKASKIDIHIDTLKTYITKNLVSTISQLQDYLLKEKGLYVEQSWLYRYCKKNSIRLIKKQD